MEPMLLWGFALLGAAALLFVIELFVPTGGVLGFVAAAVAVASVVAFWKAGTWWGVGSALTVLTAAPLGFNFAIKVMPNTAMGRRLILQGDDDEDASRREAEQLRADQAAKAVIGALGTAITPLRPIGLAEVEGQRVEVLAEGGPIDAGEAIKVTSVVDNQLRVRRAS